METFGRHIVGPLNGSSIIVVDSDWTGGEFMENAEIEKDIGNVLQLFGALINGADFCFSGTASCIGLAFGGPV